MEILLRVTASLLLLFPGLYCAEADAETWGEARDCLVENMLMEARNQGIDGMAAVAQVTVNRANSSKFPDAVCDVVWQPKQFSWTHQQDKMIPINPNVESGLYHYAYLIAGAVLDGEYTDLVNGAMWYHRDDIKPYWADSYQVTSKIGRHIFYTSEPR